MRWHWPWPVQRVVLAANAGRPVMTALAISVATLFSTLLGGLLALRLQRRLHLVTSFSAGAILGVAFFDLIPEALDLTAQTVAGGSVLSIVAAAFLACMVLDRSFAPADDASPPSRPAGWRGALGALILTLHSYLDGFAIGLAFTVSRAVGIAVSVAVLVHDFSDGINSVGVVLGNRGNERSARNWLIANAIAPVAGAGSTLFLNVGPHTLAALLALCAGFFIYLSAGDLVPESYRQRPTAATTLATILGAITLFLVTKLSGS